MAICRRTYINIGCTILLSFFVATPYKGEAVFLLMQPGLGIKRNLYLIYISRDAILNHKLLRCLRLKTLLTPALPPSRSQKGRSRRCTGTWSADWLVCSTRGSSLARRPPPSPLSPRRILCFQAAKDLVSLPPGASR